MEEIKEYICKTSVLPYSIIISKKLYEILKSTKKFKEYFLGKLKDELELVIIDSENIFSRLKDD